uniref:Uncharacterized protein n=1 Tax=Anguilla anguilla TaxID=7936 RepID=A0A0E9UWF2_ANGAN
MRKRRFWEPCPVGGVASVAHSVSNSFAIWKVAYPFYCLFSI